LLYNPLPTMALELEIGEAFDLNHFRAEAEAGPAAFTKAHGHGFLILSSADAGLEVPKGPRKTVAVALRDLNFSPTQYLVWPVRKSGRSLTSLFISVGRTRTNDVIVPDVSLSKFHAFFKLDGEVFSVQDGRSRNGTFVDGARVAAQGEGPPTIVRSGARVRFGGVEMLFLAAEKMRMLVLELG
jgi:hypothetical protein